MKTYEEFLNEGEQLKLSLDDIDISKVASAYSGKPGCMCGCRGKYYYTTEHAKDAGKQRGYEVEDNEINDSMVKKVTKILNSHKSECDDFGTGIYYKQSDNHCYAIYFLDPVK
jgi:hypothetical protein